MPTPSSDSFDVVVLGAGAAGLAAAAELSKHELDVCVLEARDRLGGRILTRYEPGEPMPLELGAEFIHGRAESTRTWLARAGATAIDASQTRFSVQDGRLAPSEDLFEQMKQGLERARRPRKDLPLTEFLDGPARRFLKPRVREFARMLVEGYDAADATRVSTLETLDEWSGDGAADAPTFRPLGGYEVLVRGLAGALDPTRVAIRFNSPVSEVCWAQGHVRIQGERHGEAFQIEASRAVVTLPLGVLQARGGVRFTPALTSKESALASLGFGPVVKVLLRFREPFWESLAHGEHRDAAFFHAPDAPFPTLWSSLPMRSSVLSAWTGGPNARRLAGATHDQLTSKALESVDAIFGKRAKAASRLTGAWAHDWQADPYARGAYSYVLAGGSGARRSLAAPLNGVLFFGGEAADTEGESGTVAGALQSGARAAREVLRSLEHSSRRRPRKASTAKSAAQARE